MFAMSEFWMDKNWAKELIVQKQYGHVFTLSCIKLPTFWT
jgi:hypothetical protein